MPGFLRRDRLLPTSSVPGSGEHRHKEAEHARAAQGVSGHRLDGGHPRTGPGAVEDAARDARLRRIVEGVPLPCGITGSMSCARAPALR
ncbi:hypothetical protein Sgou_05360 [Streptomyces gougerotii]|uniref:Uncharacterized protein n=1 Tax=Streptomyces gougerotii TaxID=53448 RepID=A0A8H9HXD8_9ACTN|nr:hypothetical protein Sgou_05360 [Streptomyces gougerotii]GGU91726.1 hypothetical protein GCM10010227_53800 [Streptomyces gougerotii]